MGWSPSLEVKSAIKGPILIMDVAEYRSIRDHPAATGRSASHRLVPVGVGTLNGSIHTITLDQCIECPDTIHES